MKTKILFVECDKCNTEYNPEFFDCCPNCEEEEKDFPTFIGMRKEE